VKVFFSEEKKQKTFISPQLLGGSPRPQMLNLRA
jgi:hypothetical protein